MPTDLTIPRPTPEDKARDLAADYATCRAATPGPWFIHERTGKVCHGDPTDDRENYPIDNPEDYDFVAAVIPGWEAALRLLHAERQAWQARQAAEADVWHLRKDMRCRDCGALWTSEKAKERCDMAHRDTWPHDWISELEQKALALCGQHLSRAEMAEERVKVLESSLAAFREAARHCGYDCEQGKVMAAHKQAEAVLGRKEEERP